MHAQKDGRSRSLRGVHYIYKETCGAANGLWQQLARYTHQSFDSTLYSTIEECNNLIPLDIPGCSKVRQGQPAFISNDCGHSDEIVDLCLSAEDPGVTAVERHASIDFTSIKPASDWSYSPASGVQDELSTHNVKRSMALDDSTSFTNPDHDDDISTVSSISVGSVFSTSTLATSVTDFSRDSGFHVEHIAIAARELLSILVDNENLTSLYTAAIYGPIRPREFRVTFTRLLKILADRLKEEAVDYLEFTVARFVALKARDISHAILERYQSERRLNSDAIGQGRDNFLELDDQDQFDEDEPKEGHVDEAIFEEIIDPGVFKFVAQSSAFELLKTELKQFLLSRTLSREAPKEKANSCSEERTSQPTELLSMHAQTQELIAQAINRNWVDIVEHGQHLRQFQVQALASLGEDCFVAEYSELLRCCYGISNKASGNSSALSLPDWKPVASGIVHRLRMLDVDHENPTSNAPEDASSIEEPLGRNNASEDLPALDVFSRNVALLALRGSLRDIIVSTPVCAMELSSVNETSFLNKMKAFLEDYTKAEWDWWPLTPRVPNVGPGNYRLEWRLGGVRLYEIVSSLENNAIKWAIRSLPHDSEQCYYCHADNAAKTSRLWSSQRTRFRLAATATSPSSSASSTTTRSFTLTASTPLSSSQTTGGINTTPLLPSNSNAPLHASGQPAAAPSAASPKLPKYILFAVQGWRWSLEMEQIIINDLVNDPIFFRELKVRYKKHRNWIKRFISPFRFRFCRFVKLEKFDKGRVLSQGDDLPDYMGFENDYEYAPLPGTNPMISHKTFAVCLKACDMKCKWPWLNPWHDCIGLPCRNDMLACIPKRKSEFDIHSDDTIAVAWGLEADHAISFAFMAVYHLVPLLAAFGFWIYWLIKFPGDWQNAAVPVLTVLAIFAVLWVPFGKHLGIV